MDRIEELRRRLLSSREPIDIRYHGSPWRDRTLSKDEATAGVVVRRTIGEACERAAVPAPWGRWLFRLVREFRPVRCLELGTSLGISAAYLGAALALNGRGSLLTLEGAEVLAGLARENLRSLGLDTVEVRAGRHEELLPQVLYETERLDFAFVDGRHEEAAVLDTVERLLPRLSREAVLVLDDVAWSDGMRRAWQQIRGDPRLSLAIDAGRMAVCVGA